MENSNGLGVWRASSVALTPSRSSVPSSCVCESTRVAGAWILASRNLLCEQLSDCVQYLWLADGMGDNERQRLVVLTNEPHLRFEVPPLMIGGGGRGDESLGGSVEWGASRFPHERR